MPKRLPKVARDHLEKAREAAMAAVKAYNKPGSRFRTAQYIVLIVMAWTALFHAIFLKSGHRPWHRKKTKGEGRLLREGGRRAEVLGSDRGHGMTYADTYISVTIGSDFTVGRIVRDAHDI